MKKSVLVLLLLSFTITMLAQRLSDKSKSERETAFAAFLKDFKEWKEPTLSPLIFGETPYTENGYIEGIKIYGIESDNPFLPDNLVCDCREADDVYWKKGSYIKKDNFLVLFMTRECDDSHSSEFLMYDDYVVATYTYDGKFIHSYIVGRSGRAHHVSMEGDLNTLRFTTEQASLPDPNILYDELDQHYCVQKYAFKIGKDGLIRRQSVGKPWIKTILADTTKLDKTTLKEHLWMFRKLDSKSITASAFKYSGNCEYSDLDKIFVRTFLPDSAGCDCEKYKITWVPCSYVETNNYYVLLYGYGCPIPHEGYPFGADVIVTYTKRGEIIDYTEVAREGDEYVSEIESRKAPLTLRVRQGRILNLDNQQTSDIEVTEYTISIGKDGKLKKTIEREPYVVKGVYDNKRYTYVLPKK